MTSSSSFAAGSPMGRQHASSLCPPSPRKATDHSAARAHRPLPWRGSPHLLCGLGVGIACPRWHLCDLEPPGRSRDQAHIVPGHLEAVLADRKSTRLNSSHVASSYAVFCLEKKI